MKGLDGGQNLVWEQNPQKMDMADYPRSNGLSREMGRLPQKKQEKCVLCGQAGSPKGEKEELNMPRLFFLNLPQMSLLLAWLGMSKLAELQ